MKRFSVLFSLLTLYCGIAFAQTEAAADTLRHTADDIPPTGEQLLPDGVKSYDGFLIDLNSLMKLPAQGWEKPFQIVIPDASKDYNRIFRLNPDVTYSSGLNNMFSLSGSPYFSSNPFGLMGFGSTTDNLQMGSFRLKNGWRLNTYGQYDKDGRRVSNPSALPWQQNDFKGAFELKSQNGSFGIRIEVQKGRETPFFH
ncbi:occludin [uncultured Bacteroides sp.]|uniref:occludin n=1 Tax=uncultured Bacteroides sp. TaxID=162156 RepID=UPI0026281EF6|nr:occludin [uncultured Bacteroides sp.]